MKSIPELSIDSKILYERLSTVKRGELITYDELSKEVSRPVDSSTTYLTTARRIAMREDDKIFEAVRGIGLKCLTDAEIASGIGVNAILKVRRLSRLAAGKLSKVQDFDGLPNDAKIKHNMAMSILGVFSMASAPRKIKKIEGAFKQKVLPTAETINMFK